MFIKSANLLILSCVAVCSFSLPSVSQVSTGVIKGSVVNETGQSVLGAIVRIDPIDSRPQSSMVRTVETDQNGHFAMTSLKFGAYKVFAMKESAGYANTAFSFYSNNEFVTATLSVINPAINLVLKVGPPAGVLNGHVRDAATGHAVSAAFVLRRNSAPDNWISLSEPPNYKLLLPAGVDVLLEVSAPGYRTAYYGGSSDPQHRSPIHLSSKQEMELNIQLEPLSESTK